MRIDLRSDTLTQPTPEMRRAMMDAVVGDDVYGEDPTINALETRAAELTGKEAALFMPTGSMGNAAALLSHCAPGSEVICESASHVYNYELASMAVFGGLLPRVLPGMDGRMAPADIRAAIQPPVYYRANAGLVCLENTHNLAGGTVLEPAYMADVRAIADAHTLPIHLDGARIFNAAVALGVPVAELARDADSVMFCLSKGLCAPVGSLLAGTREFIARARVHRKRLGGGMRQAGVLAAAGLVALDTIPPLLADDHEKIRRFVRFFQQYPFIRLNAAATQTNILIFGVDHPRRSAADLLRLLAEQDVIASGFGDRIRLVAYRDITFPMVDRCLEILAELFRQQF
ncbi:MAG TPA: GntG family PLP-dependent aldolase [Acidobacteriota bacterium]|nr:GntG family PLP-dependent aldolase [Acidobacteriota bacterium]HQF86186.1 GntG family PLP-dependent aldolase [Acidobacteriota bacterium]HQG90570.1 GntG family PLP-dependent aldolase [Acidobacteriota bacterium]HQK86210.1 GntG family PLP-dependent aldolase [Acidobacteriota bacterium]